MSEGYHDIAQKFYRCNKAMGFTNGAFAAKLVREVDANTARLSTLSPDEATLYYATKMYQIAHLDSVDAALLWRLAQE